jgi:hypothetical protein
MKPSLCTAAGSILTEIPPDNMRPQCQSAGPNWRKNLTKDIVEAKHMRAAENERGGGDNVNGENVQY